MRHAHSPPYHPGEPQWFWPARPGIRPPSDWQDWLADSGSLTARLQARCPSGFAVRLLRQGWSHALRSECRHLGCPPHRACLVREVVLGCGPSAWVYARTLIPATSLHGAARRLGHLGNRPLGALLFYDPSANRLAMEFARLQAGQQLYETASRIAGVRPLALWGRRTLSRYAGKPLLVNEDIPSRTGFAPA